jgi:hypothetical protein
MIRSLYPRQHSCEFQETLSFCQQSVSQCQLIFSWLFNDLRLFVGKSIKMHFPFRAAIFQHMVSTIGVDKSTKCGAPGSCEFQEFLSFCQQSVSQPELIFSRLFNDLRLFDGKRIKMNFPFRAAIFQHMVGVERKWGHKGKIVGKLALEGHPNEMDDPP